ncbi:hypothetical protein Kpol_1073p12 [Vanderwaltozyma polyspora DSM 70294]|uniref:ATPase expression protein 1, mitochondrial n=1 Tax=Vanderwaltozyma polyspora (strain ATCC 22028 / DSM 70294 / BCRC 21397 / CBS 2163 / NBRC 10782 / NRRL Y-8283 / UCD 57-17) TaxID=436907 RepID=AEP1_VANPO|nr:uncharacterized protein Kpol_1073p12 [Vanderwaltozyma polyspora DSM 70294]A7TPS5.1 RecName: Full=ATPase expression protein 1, mitochondrial; Flags: Precursor [Vanderwaltozyma polyspora DSM 70294]EDO15726.1 hypothetical protein Kpol_1073p12 [Vanderwaltozyma polyspora DSM 70294]
MVISKVASKCSPKNVTQSMVLVPSRNIASRKGFVKPIDPKEIIHPFYRPSQIEEFTLCSTERNPSLMDGKPVFPISLPLLSTSVLPQLLYKKIIFPSVRNIVPWLKKFNYIRIKNYSDEYYTIDFKPLEMPTVESKLTITNFPELKILVDLLENTNGGRTDIHNFELCLNNILQKRMSTRLFVEDIYIYLIQNYVTTIPKLILVTKSIKNHLNNGIDHLSILEKLVNEILYLVHSKKFTMDLVLMNTFNGLLKEADNKFNTHSSKFGFSETTKESLLMLYIQAEDIHSSKELLGNLISKKSYPKDEIILAYLDLINKAVYKSNPENAILQRLSYTSNFFNIINHTTNPEILRFFIHNSRHFKEIQCVLDMILKKKNRKDIVLPLCIDLIEKTVSVSDSAVSTSLNLTRLSDYFETMLGMNVRIEAKEVFMKK